MSDQPETVSWQPVSAESSDSQVTAGERPEIAVGAVFASGFLLALILKRLAR